VAARELSMVYEKSTFSDSSLSISVMFSRFPYASALEVSAGIVSPRNSNSGAFMVFAS